MIKLHVNDSDFQKALSSDKYGWCFVDDGDSDQIFIVETATLYVVPNYSGIEKKKDAFVPFNHGQKIEIHNNNSECVGKVDTVVIHETFQEVFIIIDLILL